jgi:hypothetical protein
LATEDVEVVPAVALAPPELEAPPLLDDPPLAVVPPVPVEPPFEVLAAVVPPEVAVLVLVVPPDFDEPPLALVPPRGLLAPPEPEAPPELDTRSELEAPPELEDPPELGCPPELLPPEEVMLLLCDDPPEDDDWLEPPWAPLSLLLEPPLPPELPCDAPALSSAPHPTRAVEKDTAEPNKIAHINAKLFLFERIKIILNHASQVRCVFCLPRLRARGATDFQKVFVPRRSVCRLPESATTVGQQPSGAGSALWCCAWRRSPRMRLNRSR